MTPEAVVIESLFMIADKDGVDVPFKLNSTQKALDEALTGRDQVPKARQEGVSAYFLARYTAKCLGQRNRRCVVISHDKESTQRMLARVRYYLDNLRGPKAILSHASKNEFTFPKTGSMFYIGTAGARKFGRGDTITDLHCSEVAFWPDPKTLTAGLFQAVPKSGEIALESTGNGVGNFYHKRVMRAEQGKSKYTNHFFNWQDFKEYSHDLTPEEEQRVLNTLDLDLEEDIVHAQGLTAGQIAWRRDKLEEMDFDLSLFKQEYPMTLLECFQTTGHSIFFKVRYVQSAMWERQSKELYTLGGHPKPGYHYMIGADPAGGVEEDNSCAQIVCLETMEQVAEWASNKVPPDSFGRVLLSLGKDFNNAYIVVELNNHGPVTLGVLRGNYPDYLLFKNRPKSSLDAYGFRTGQTTKKISVGVLRRLLASELIIHSELLKGELDTFVEHDDGSLGASVGCLDDRVMAMVMFTAGWTKAALMFTSPPPEEIEYTEPFSLEAMIEEFRARGITFPIKPQHGTLGVPQ